MHVWAAGDLPARADATPARAALALLDNFGLIAKSWVDERGDRHLLLAERAFAAVGRLLRPDDPALAAPLGQSPEAATERLAGLARALEARG